MQFLNSGPLTVGSVDTVRHFSSIILTIMDAEHQHNPDAPESGGTGGGAYAKYRVYVWGKPDTHMFTRPLIWTLLHAEGKMYTTILGDTDIVDMVKLKQRAICVVPFAEMVAGDETGLIDFWPDRVKVGEKYGVPERWKNHTVSGLKQEIEKVFPIEQWGAHCYWGKAALRVRVPKAQYAGIAKVARGLGLQFERVGTSPISTAMLKVRNVSGTQDGFVLAVHQAQSEIEARFPGMSWGRGDMSLTETTAIAYVPQVLTVSDHLTSLRDGYRVVFTPSLAQPSTKVEIASIVKAVKDVAEKVLCDDTLENYAIKEDQCPVDQRANAELELQLINEALASARTALAKAERSWRPLNLPSATVIATIEALSEAGKKIRADQEHDSIETFAAWVNLCPTPATVSTHFTVGEDTPALGRLQTLLGGTFPPTKPKMLSELKNVVKTVAASTGDAESGKKTYKQAAADSTKSVSSRHPSVRK